MELLTGELKAYISYKDTGEYYLGEIPSHWKTKKGKWLFVKKERPVNANDEIITCFRDGEVTLRKNRKTEGFTIALKEHGYQGIRKGDLVIHNMDAFAGAIGVSDSDGKSTPVYSVCAPYNPDEVDTYYYAYFLRNLARRGFIQSLAKGIRERSTDFRYYDFGLLFLPLPPKKEQVAITQFLNSKIALIDKAISIKERQIELLKERRDALINKAVTKGLDSNAKMKDSGVEWIGQIPEHWEVKKVKHITSKIGSGVTPAGGGTTYLDSGIPLLRSQNVLFGKISLENVAYISEKTHASMSNSQVKKGDILLNITGGSIGRCHFVDFDRVMNVNQHVCIIRPDKIESSFLSSVLASQVGQGQIWYFQQGGGREGLNFQAIKNFLIPYPPLHEQRGVTEYLNEVAKKTDTIVSVKQAEIEKLKEYKASLINGAVTGKIKVC